MSARAFWLVLQPCFGLIAPLGDHSATPRGVAAVMRASGCILTVQPFSRTHSVALRNKALRDAVIGVLGRWTVVKIAAEHMTGGRE